MRPHGMTVDELLQLARTSRADSIAAADELVAELAAQLDRAAHVTHRAAMLADRSRSRVDQLANVHPANRGAVHEAAHTTAAIAGRVAAVRAAAGELVVELRRLGATAQH